MLVLHFPSLRPKPIHYTPPAVFGSPPANYTSTNGGRYPTQLERDLAKKRGITAEEWVRRDLVIKAAWRDCRFTPGEAAFPIDAADRKIYGKLRVRGIVKSYSEFSNAEQWPENDVPYVIVCDREDGKGGVWCTNGFLEKEAANGATC